MSKHQKVVNVYDLGYCEYQKAWDIQKSEQKRLIDEKLAARSGNQPVSPSPDVLLFVEHPHVFTIGKSGDINNLLKGEGELRSLNAAFVRNDRGGDITYHGPGQIVGYPVMDLDRYYTDIHRYLRDLEEVIIRVCAEYGLKGERIDKLTGVWIDGKKICAFGVKCSRWVTMHGFALNVNTNLSYFGAIVPCGIPGKPVTSLKQIIGKDVNMNEVKTKILYQFSDVFSVDVHTQGF